MIIRIAAASVPIGFLKRKYTGIPSTPARLKKISCLFVKFKATFVLTFVRSFGTGTYAIMHVLLSKIGTKKAACDLQTACKLHILLMLNYPFEQFLIIFRSRCHFKNNSVQFFLCI